MASNWLQSARNTPISTPPSTRLSASGYADQMLIQRMKKRKLALKDRIIQLENILLPDIIA